MEKEIRELLRQESNKNPEVKEQMISLGTAVFKRMLIAFILGACVAFLVAYFIK